MGGAEHDAGGILAAWVSSQGPRPGTRLLCRALRLYAFEVCRKRRMIIVNRCTLYLHRSPRFDLSLNLQKMIIVNVVRSTPHFYKGWQNPDVVSRWSLLMTTSSASSTFRQRRAFPSATLCNAVWLHTCLARRYMYGSSAAGQGDATATERTLPEARVRTCTRSAARYEGAVRVGR